jgi:hypothetical protein
LELFEKEIKEREKKNERKIRAGLLNFLIKKQIVSFFFFW